MFPTSIPLVTLSGFLHFGLCRYILLVYFMPGVIELDTSFKTSVEYVDLTNSIIYLVDNDGLLVEMVVSTTSDDDMVNKIRNLLGHLSAASNEIIPNGLNHVFDSDISLLDVYVDEDIAFLKLNTALKVSLFNNKSSLLVPDLLISIAGKILFSDNPLKAFQIAYPDSVPWLPEFH